MIAFAILFYVFFIALALTMAGLWIWMIIDVATREPEGNDRLIWLLVVLLAGGIGALIYFFARKLPRERALRRAPVIPLR